MASNKIKAVILANETKDDHGLWLKACERYHEAIDYRVVNLTAGDWFEAVHREEFDVLLARPGGLTASYKQLYDERIHILGLTLGYPVFPAPLEIFIYENKRFFYSWLKATQIPHPGTVVCYERREALTHVEKCMFPVVAKLNIGASGSGIRIIEDRDEAVRYIERTFSSKGAPKRWGPNFASGGILKRGVHYLLHPADIKKKIDIYRTKFNQAQTGFVLFQEYIPHEFEWRVVRIGESFFAHKKLKAGEKASGSLLKGYENPPLGLLDFVREITEKHGLYSQAVDVFESERGYLVNEMQCFFGQSDPHQMLVDGIPGRYIRTSLGWKIEKGEFNQNQCFDLRLEYVIGQFKGKRS
ncbi:MAG: hypothetical protein EHM45_02890 [Desulfobacteraceae bacterium]|nr:MAG: hypothetical protein EHM45_02890 [Desulfobacteraceae bacterium]